MNKLLTSCLVFLITICPTLSFSMEDENRSVSIFNCSRETLAKAAYVSTFFLGNAVLSTCACIRISSLAQEHHHPDPESEGIAAFIGTQAVGSTIAALGYNYCFNNKPQTVPVVDGMHGKPKNDRNQQNTKKSSEKAWKDAVRRANNMKVSTALRHRLTIPKH